MSFSKESAVTRAKTDLAQRLKISGSDIREVSVRDQDFPDGALGAPVGDEMAMQMISSGWKIVLNADDKEFEYRADKYQIRFVSSKGNQIVAS